MAYTSTQLINAYVAVNDGVAPDAGTGSSLVALANGPDAAALAYVLNSADKTTSVAELNYQFFTGKSPTAAGLDYLVNSPANPNDLNDPYYAKFGIENRYINFAANLGVTGEGAAAFASKYAGMTFADYITSIYGTIVGVNYATSAGINASNAIADIVGRQSAFADIARAAGLITSGSSTAQSDLAIKAAAAGYVIAESIKADVGLYAAAANNFAFARISGSALYNVDLVATYAPLGGGVGSPIAPYFFPTPDPGPSAPVNASFRLTTGADAFTGGDGNDNFDASDLAADGVTHAAVLTAGDALDGGAGTDTLTIVSGTGAAFTGAGISVNNIEIASLATNSTVNLDATGWTGLSKLGVTSVGATTVKAPSPAAITVATTGLGAGALNVDGGSTVTVNASGDDTGNVTVGSTLFPTGAIVVNVGGTSVNPATRGSITVTGGTSVEINQIAANPVNTTQNLGTITVNGRALTTSVTVANAPKATAGAGAAGVNTNTVAVYDVNGGSASTKVGVITAIDVANYTVFGTQDNALTTLSLTGGSGNVIIDNSSSLAPGLQTTTLNVTTKGLTGGTLDDADVYSTINVTAMGVDSTLANITDTALTTLTVAGTNRLTLVSTAGMTALKTVTVSGSAGLTANVGGLASLTSVDASASSGAMTVTINATKATYLGGSGSDVVTVTGGLTKAISLGGGNDTLILGSLVPTVAVSGEGGVDTLSMDATAAANASGSGTFAGFVTGFEALTLTGATNQTIDLTVLGGYNSVTTRGGNGLTLQNIASGGTVTLDGAGTAYTLANAAFTAGTNDTINLVLTDKSGAGVSFASTGITANGVENFAITTTDAQTTPSGSFNDAVTLVGNSYKTVTVTGNAGLTLNSTSTSLTVVDASGVTLGGFNYFAASLASAATVSGSATGTNTVNLSSATQVVTYVGGTGNDTVTVSGAANMVNVGSGVDRVNITAASANSAIFTSITGLTAGGGDKLGLTGNAAAMGPQVVGQATFQNYIDAAAAGDGHTTAIVRWFQFGGDTYVVQDSSAASTFVDGVDQVVKLVGLLDLSASAVSASVITL